jgi:hypothetical protein
LPRFLKALRCNGGPASRRTAFGSIRILREQPGVFERLLSPSTDVRRAGHGPGGRESAVSALEGSTVTLLEAFNRCPFPYGGLRAAAGRPKEFDEDFSD